MIELNKVFLLLGSNIEPRNQYLNDAMIHISDRIGKIINSSKVYESEAMGFESDNLFYNKVIIVSTSLEAEDVLKGSLNIEKKLGRIRNQGTDKILSSRTIDIDILYYNDCIVNNENLIIPHPRLHQRRFTLEPLCEISPDYIHPAIKKNNKELLRSCNDNSVVTAIYEEADEEL